MRSDGKMQRLPDTSLESTQSAARFARWVEEQQRREIGKRLWELRENSPHTNRSIGDAVGVSERTVAEWVAGRQGITYDHAKAVAALFDTDLDWFWRGKQAGPAPDPFATEATEAVAALQAKLDAVLDGQAELLAALSEVRDEQERLRKRPARGARGRAANGS